MKAMKRIEAYDGTSDVERWINRFELAVKLDGLTDREADVLSMYVDGSAYDTWHRLTDEAKSDPSIIKSELRKVYGMRRTEAWQSALSRRIMIGENLDVAGEEILRLLSTATSEANTYDRVAGLILLNALPSNVREQVSLNLGDQFTYDDVISCANKIWPSANKGVVAISSAKSMQTKIMPQMGKVRCHCCNREGHIRRDCRLRCFRCGRQGHKSNECNSAVPLNAEKGTAEEVPVPEQK